MHYLAVHLARETHAGVVEATGYKAKTRVLKKYNIKQCAKWVNQRYVTSCSGMTLL